MVRYISVIFFIGLIYWSCEEEKTINPLIGTWEMRYIERLVETDSTLNYRVNSNDENHVTLILNEDGSYSISSFISDERITENTETTIYEMTGGWNTDNDTITFEENTEDVSVYDNLFYISADVLSLFNTYGGGEYDFLLSYLYDRK